MKLKIDFSGVYRVCLNKRFYRRALEETRGAIISIDIDTSSIKKRRSTMDKATRIQTRFYAVFGVEKFK